MDELSPECYIRRLGNYFFKEIRVEYSVLEMPFRKGGLVSSVLISLIFLVLCWCLWYPCFSDSNV